MTKEMKNTYTLTSHGSMVQSHPLLSDQPSNVGTILPMGAKSMSNAALDAAIEYELRMGTLDPNMDRKHMRRVVSNRYAAKKCHDKKFNKMAELEKNQKYFEDTLATLRPQIEHERQVTAYLRLENEILTEQLQISTDLNKLKDAEIAEKKIERKWLRGLLGIQEPDVGPSE